jgi:hypothetical protein
MRFEIVVRIVVTNFHGLDLPRWPQIFSPLLNARTLPAMGRVSSNSTVGMVFTCGFTATAENTGGYGIGRLDEKNPSPLL